MVTSEAREWGGFNVIYESDDTKVKVLTIQPGQMTSMQRHMFRSESMTVLSGMGILVTRLNSKRTYETESLFKNSVANVSAEVWHQIINNTSEPLVILEVQRGLCREDDIVRAWDIYGRS